jgi:hypothetical protein
MNKIYTDLTRCDHDELGDSLNKVVWLESPSNDLDCKEKLTELALVESLKLHFSTASLLDKLRC